MTLQPNQFQAFSVVVLRSGDELLMLQRAAWKSFAPNLWTGIGGHYEQGEYDDLAAGALRELEEEANIEIGQVRHFTLRRAVLNARPGHPLSLLLYYTGEVDAMPAPPCPEGTLQWVNTETACHLPIVQTTRPVLPLLLTDWQRDPDGQSALVVGVGAFSSEGIFEGITWNNGERSL